VFCFSQLWRREKPHLAASSSVSKNTRQNISRGTVYVVAPTREIGKNMHKTVVAQIQLVPCDVFLIRKFGGEIGKAIGIFCRIESEQATSRRSYLTDALGVTRNT
jgi:hypothetical protein